MRNWQKYSFEFLSIFVAVISAFALNNWNENRKTKHAESKILWEIFYGLEKDLEDVNMNIKGHEHGIRAANFYRNLLGDNPVSTDSISFFYFYLTRDLVSIQNTSGYETLKSRGFEIIENDSLRTKIISLYEYNYNILRKLEEEYYEMQFEENYFKEINNVFSRNFIFDENRVLKGIATPLRLSGDEEKLMLTYLWKIQMNRKFILQYYAEVSKKIANLRSEIKAELED